MQPETQKGDEASPMLPQKHKADKYEGEPYKGREI
jgi:hypothetical protein